MEIQHAHALTHICRGSDSESAPQLLSVERDSWLIMAEIYRILNLTEINLEGAEIYYVLAWNSLCGAAPAVKAYTQHARAY